MSEFTEGGSFRGEHTFTPREDLNQIVRNRSTLMEQSRDLWSEIHATLDRIQKEKNIFYREEAFKDPEVAPLISQSKELTRQIEELGLEVIRENIKRFNLDDLQVTARRDIKSKRYGEVVRTVDVGNGRLSEFIPSHLQPKAELTEGSTEEMDPMLLICVGDEQIGYFNGDLFQFTSAPDLRTCVGWVVACGFGREKLLKEYDLVREVSKLENAIKKARPLFEANDEKALKELFFEGDWKKAMTDVMSRGKCSEMGGDGLYVVITTFWKVATRTILGKEHPG